MGARSGVRWVFEVGGVGHSTERETERYTHPDLEETRAQMERVGEKKSAVQ